MIADTHPLSGKLIQLRIHSHSDYEEEASILNDTVTMKALIPFFGRSLWTSADIKRRFMTFESARLNKTGIPWMIVSLEDNRIVGSCGFTNINVAASEAEFGIILHRSVWGKGHAQESHLLGLQYGFDALKLNRIYFDTDTCNLRMQKFFDKAGIGYASDTEQGYLRYELTQSQWPSTATALRQMIDRKI